MNNLSLESDRNFVSIFEAQGGDGVQFDEAESCILNKVFKNLELVEGNVFITLPLFLIANPAPKISFLHLDLDVKDPTEFVLN